MSILDEQAKTSQQLQDKGFEVQWGVKGASGAEYDLVAQRDGRKIVFEFKRSGQLSLESGDISRLRQSARQDGFSDFRLVVVPDDKPVTVDIPGLNSEIFRWLETHPEVKSGTLLENCDVVFQRVEQVEISSVAAKSGNPGLRVSGLAVVIFVASSLEPDAIWDCPIYFDANLNANNQLENVNQLVLDLSSISDDLQEYLQEHLLRGANITN